MPVPSKVRGIPRNHDQVADPGRDLVLASRAQVRLAGLERLDAADLDLAEVGIDQRGISAHSSSPATAANDNATIK